MDSVTLEVNLAAIEQQLQEMMEENGGDEGLLLEVIEGDGDKLKITAKAIKVRLKEIGKDPEYAEEGKTLNDYSALLDKQTDIKSKLKAAKDDLDAKLDIKYPKLTETDIKMLVVDDKWIATLLTVDHTVVKIDANNSVAVKNKPYPVTPAFFICRLSEAKIRPSVRVC